MSTALCLLILEDDPYDAELEIATLEESGYVCRWQRVETRAEFLARLGTSDYDLILADYRLPAFDGLTALKLVIERDLDLPFILVSGALGEEVAIESLKAGATDYVLKDRLSRLGPVVRRALREKEEQRQRKRAEEAMRKSEQRYRSLFEGLPVGLYRMTPQGLILHANPALVQMLGYPDRRALMAVNALDLYVDAEDYERQQALLEREGIVRDFEMQFRRYDGTVIWVRNTVQAVRSDRRDVFYYEGSMEDITERKRAEEERDRLLAQTRGQAQQVQQIMDTVPEGVLLLDAGGQVILANPLGRKDLAALANASVGNTLTHLGDRPLAELLTSPYQGFWHEVALEGPPPRVFEIIAKFIETGPAPDGWVLVIRDVTREREFQRYSQQQERLATVGQLAAGIAHDFNNIMATIVLYAQMLSQTEDLSPRGHERLATVNQQAMHATNLTQQILDFSRRAVLERRPLNLLPLLKEQVKLLERTLPENIEIVLAYGPDEYTVNADPTRVQQALMNLAVNARDAMPEGGDLRFGLERIQVQPGESPPLPEMEAGEWVQVTVAEPEPASRPIYCRISSIPSSPPKRRARARAWDWPRYTAS